MRRGIRDHGYGDSPEVEGVPVVEATMGGSKCPNCGCVTQAIAVAVSNPHKGLEIPEGHRAVGRYYGCPACPWASPMVTRAEPRVDPKMIKMVNLSLGIAGDCIYLRFPEPVDVLIIPAAQACSLGLSMSDLAAELCGCDSYSAPEPEDCSTCAESGVCPSSKARSGGEVN